jgi:uncharacterized membrane protein YgcG
MRDQRHPASTRLGRWLFVGVAPLFAVALAAIFVPTTHASALAGPEPGKHVYDLTGLLTSAEIADLETHAKTVEQAGAPTIVYLQAKDATYDQTHQDAGNLMNDWNVESATGARDGFVMFLNLIPGNLRHGQVVLFAGQKYFQNGPLTHEEAQRIYQDEMLPLLRDGDIAGGIAAGLDAVAHDMTYGLPAPPRLSAFQQAVGGIGALILAALAILFTLSVSLLHTTARNRLPQTARATVPLSASPNDLVPALVGALVMGHTSDAQMEATLLDFARRGLIVIEPLGPSQLDIRLIGNRTSLTPFEASLWHGMKAVAGSRRIIRPGRMGSLRSHFAPALSALRRELVARGWYDPAIGEKRKPLYVMGGLNAGVATSGGGNLPLLRHLGVCFCCTRPGDDS